MPSVFQKIGFSGSKLTAWMKQSFDLTNRLISFVVSQAAWCWYDRPRSCQKLPHSGLSLQHTIKLLFIIIKKFFLSIILWLINETRVCYSSASLSRSSFATLTVSDSVDVKFLSIIHLGTDIVVSLLAKTLLVRQQSPSTFHRQHMSLRIRIARVKY